MSRDFSRVGFDYVKVFHGLEGNIIMGTSNPTNIHIFVKYVISIFPNMSKNN